MEEIGCVLNSLAGRATVRIPRSEECAGCHGCAAMDPERGMIAEVEDPLGASPGDTVRIRSFGVEGKLKAALLLFGFPLLLMLAGAIGSQALYRRLPLGGLAELLSVLTGLVLMAGAFALVYAVRRARGKLEVRSRIVEVLERSQAGELT